MELGAMAKAFHPHGRTREDCVHAQGMTFIPSLFSKKAQES